MAATVIPTITTGDVATAAWGNTHLRDNINGILTVLDLVAGGPTADSVLYGNGASALGEVALSNGRVVAGNASSVPVAVHLLTAFNGFLRHEFGGIEADISAIAKGGLLAGTGAGIMAILPAGADGKFLRYLSSEATGLVADDVSAFTTMAVSDTLVASADTTRGSSTTSFVKVKEFSIDVAGAYRIKFDMLSGSAFGLDTVAGEIRRNGVLVGVTETTSTLSGID